MLIDLQLHSTYSDGYLTPTQLADFLKKNNIKIASLTDHNTVGGIDEFKLACKKNGIKPIIGIEIYIKFNHKKFNLLWYHFDHKNPDLHEFLRLSQTRRRDQIRRSFLKLKNLGFVINDNKILDKYNHYVPINRIINEIWQTPNNRKIITKQLGLKKPSEEEIIKHFFKNKKVNRLDECYVDLKHILKLRKKIGGQIILNHPGKNGRIDEVLISNLKKLGLDGLEVISPHHSVRAVMQLQRLCSRYKLIMTGGSDYHLNESETSAIQNVYSYFKIDSKHLSGIDKIIS